MNGPDQGIEPVKITDLFSSRDLDLDLLTQWPSYTNLSRMPLRCTRMVCGRCGRCGRFAGAWFIWTVNGQRNTMLLYAHCLWTASG